MDITDVYINGIAYKVNCHWGKSLLDFIRDHVGLKGTKVMCRQGGCGACVVTVQTIHPVTGKQVTKAVNSCLCPIGNVIGCQITTVEGVGSQHTGYHTVQKSVADHNGSQCGYCTPGMVMSTYSLVCSNPKASSKDIEQSFDGNLCRCTGYRTILDGAKAAMCCNNQCVTDIEDLSKLQKHKKRALCVKPAYWHRPNKVTDVLELFRKSDKRSIRLVSGNTASGFLETKLNEDLIICLKDVTELYKIEVSEKHIDLGSNLSIQDIIDELGKVSSEDYPQFMYLKKTLIPLMYKIGGTPVRNTGTWAGNLMLCHQDKKFTSDLITPLEALQAEIIIVSTCGFTTTTPQQFLNMDMDTKLIVSLSLPALQSYKERFQTFKLMPREVNAFALLNAAFYIHTSEANGSLAQIEEARIVYGGLAKNMIHAEMTEKILKNKIFDKKLLKECLECVSQETCIQVNQYKSLAARNLLYFFLRNACDQRLTNEQFYDKMCTTENFILCQTSYDYEQKVDRYPACQPTPKVDSILQCSGEAQYIGDRPHIEGELQAYCVLSTQAKAKISKIDSSKAEVLPGVIRVITSKDIRGKNHLHVPELPVLPEDEVIYAGQPIAVVLAEKLECAQAGAAAVDVTYTNIKKPILDIEDAVDQDYRHSPDVPFNLTSGDTAVALSDSDYVFTGQVKGNTQSHFYLENQCCIVVPFDDMIDMWVTTQGPAATQNRVAKVIGKPMSSINTHVLRVGGAFGGKVVYSMLLASLTATAALTVNRPVRLQLDLEHNMKIQGKRSPFLAKYKVGVSSQGHINAIDVDYYHDLGSVKRNDAHFIVDQIIRCIQTVYHIPNWNVRGHLMKTDRAHTISMRAPTTVPGSFIMESIMEHVSKELNINSVMLKENHLIKEGNPCFTGGDYSKETINNIWAELKTSSRIHKWQKDIEQFNKDNAFIKRGLAVVPSRFPTVYLRSFFSYSAYVTIYSIDGTVSITHGGVEMGQGMNTKVIQTAASALNIDPGLIKVHATSSLTSANSQITGASVGSEAVCRSVLESCKELNHRLSPIRKNNPDSLWTQIIQKATAAGVDLAVSKKYVDLKDSNYSTYGVCGLEAEVNLLTGKHSVNRVDATFDVGESMNPTIDIGQIEGALCMAFGYFQFEREQYDSETGVLLTNGTWDYKVPSALDIPRSMNIKLMKGSHNTDGMMSFKAIGEPPMNCGPAVLFAVRQAIQNYRDNKDLDGKYVQLKQPTTAEDVILKSAITLDDLLEEVC